MRRRIIREAVSVSQMEEYMSMYNSMSEEEKMGWWRAIKECVKELNEQGLITSEIAVGTFSALLIIIAAVYNEPELLGFPGVALGVSVTNDIPRWKKIIACAREKREGKENNSLDSIQERKIIKLTESDLKRIVRRVIKEDEMSDTENANTCVVRLGKVEKNSSIRIIENGTAKRMNGTVLKVGDKLNKTGVESIKISKTATVYASGPDTSKPGERYVEPNFIITCGGVEAKYGD